jgi:hypothetical protein
LARRGDLDGGVGFIGRAPVNDETKHDAISLIVAFLGSAAMTIATAQLSSAALAQASTANHRSRSAPSKSMQGLNVGTSKRGWPVAPRGSAALLATTLHLRRSDATARVRWLPVIVPYLRGYGSTRFHPVRRFAMASRRWRLCLALMDAPRSNQSRVVIGARAPPISSRHLAGTLQGAGRGQLSDRQPGVGQGTFAAAGRGRSGGTSITCH